MWLGLSHGPAEEWWWWWEETLDSVLLQAKFGASFTKLPERGLCVCVYAIITTFSKHLRPPEPVFIAGKGMGQHSLGRLFWKMGEGKKMEGFRMTRRGCAEGQRAHRAQSGPFNCDMMNERWAKELAFSGKTASWDGDPHWLPGQDFTILTEWEMLRKPYQKWKSWMLWLKTNWQRRSHQTYPQCFILTQWVTFSWLSSPLL